MELSALGWPRTQKGVLEIVCVKPSQNVETIEPFLTKFTPKMNFGGNFQNNVYIIHVFILKQSKKYSFEQTFSPITVVTIFWLDLYQTIILGQH